MNELLFAGAFDHGSPHDIERTSAVERALLAPGEESLAASTAQAVGETTSLSLACDPRSEEVQAFAVVAGRTAASGSEAVGEIVFTTRAYDAL